MVPSNEKETSDAVANEAPVAWKKKIGVREYKVSFTSSWLCWWAVVFETSKTPTKTSSQLFSSLPESKGENAWEREVLESVLKSDISKGKVYTRTPRGSTDIESPRQVDHKCTIFDYLSRWNRWVRKRPVGTGNVQSETNS